MAILTAENDLANLRQSGQILVAAIQAVIRAVEPGITTAKLDQIAAKEIAARDGRGAFLGFQNYPATLCVSINHEVVHGIPKSTVRLKDGDIVGLDLGVEYQGMFTDHAVTVPVGTISPKAQQLLDDTKAALDHGLGVIKSGRRVGDISHAIEESLAPKGYGIIRQLTGHGVGRGVHEPPSVPNYGRAGAGPKLEVGMVLAIEPMVTLGGWEVETLADGWTVVTADQSLAAHFEHTIIVTKTGFECVTDHAPVRSSG